jgi:UDP-N-acetylglucosamine--N-acetylmuramyl-(pentapeptide) pyrophosphoryl-undecaprenol N-acetylglucosamine transferase
VKLFFAGGGTGGHLYPGLAIARAVVRLHPEASPFFIGARRGIERDVLPTTEFPYELLNLHPLYRRRFWENWRTIAGAIGSWRRLGALVREHQPRVVVGTGGYASALALQYAAMHGIPYVLEEQNSYPGLTMRFFARRAREIYLGYPEAQRYMRPGARTTVVDSGNPIEPPPNPRPDPADAKRAWGFPANARVLLVFGGSQGARAINDAVAAWIESTTLPQDLHILWATGKGSYDAFARLESPRVLVRPYIAPMRDAYAATDLALARSGATGTAEMCAWGIPSILVPLPTAAADHQTVNARALSAAGAAILLTQAKLSAASLDSTVRGVLTDPQRLAALARGALARARPAAAETIARRIIELVDSESAAP